MRVLICAAIVCLVAVFGGACNRPSAKKCDRACLNFVKLHFVEKLEKKRAEDPPADRAKAAKQDEAKWKKFRVNKHIKRDLVYCRAQCRSLNNHDEVNCLIHADTAKAADDCLSHNDWF